MPLKLPGLKEPFHMLLLHCLAYLSAVLLFVSCVAPMSATILAAVGVVAGCFGQSLLNAARFRWSAQAAIGGLLAMLGIAIPAMLAHSSTVTHIFGFQLTLSVVFATSATLISFGGVVALRSLTQRFSALAVVEGMVLIALAAWPFVTHRGFRLTQPRLLADWALMNGYNPGVILSSVGIIALVLIAVLRFRNMNLRQASSSVLLLLLLGASLLLLQGKLGDYLPNPDQIDPAPNPGPDPRPGPIVQDDETPSFVGHDWAQNPRPMAIISLLNDCPTLFGHYYFRATAYSQFQGERFWKLEKSSLDIDVPRHFPAALAELAGFSPNSDDLQVPMNIALLVPLPKPLTMITPVKLAPRQNTNPNLFVQTYSVTSQILRRKPDDLYHAKGGDPNWPEELRKTYVEGSQDPRYAKLAETIHNSIKPEYRDCPLAMAEMIKVWMKKHCTYSLHPKEVKEGDPSVEFLFGDKRGFCVHAAHSLALLLRARGMPARIISGYTVPYDRRAAGSSILLDENDSHCWCEVHLNGIGWVPVEGSYKDSEEPDAQHVDQTLQNFFGEQNRENNPAIKQERRNSLGFVMLGALLTGAFLFLVVAGLYLVKAWRQLAPRWAADRHLYRVCYRAVLDRLADIGLSRQFGESREDFGSRVARLIPEFSTLSEAHVHQWLSSRPIMDRNGWQQLQGQSLARLAAVVPASRRVIGWLNPIGWFLAR